VAALWTEKKTLLAALDVGGGPQLVGRLNDVRDLLNAGTRAFALALSLPLRPGASIAGLRRVKPGCATIDDFRVRSGIEEGWLR